MSSLDSFEVIDESMTDCETHNMETMNRCQDTCSRVTDQCGRLQDELTEACDMIQRMVRYHREREQSWQLERDSLQRHIAALEGQPGASHNSDTPSSTLTAIHSRREESDRLTAGARPSGDQAGLEQQMSILTDQLRAVEEERDELKKRIEDLNDDLSDAKTLAQSNAHSQITNSQDLLTLACSSLHIPKPAPLPANCRDLRQLMDRVLCEHARESNNELSHREAKLIAAEQIIVELEAEVKSLRQFVDRR